MHATFLMRAVRRTTLQFPIHGRKHSGRGISSITTTFNTSTITSAHDGKPDVQNIFKVCMAST